MNSITETLFVGQNVHSRDEVDSTNNVAASLLSESRLPEGTVIMAKEQTAGRGQHGTTWQSEYGKNLLASFIFYPSFLSPKNIFLLNITVSLALYDFANRAAPPPPEGGMIPRSLPANKFSDHQLPPLGGGGAVSIKWPNDLYYNNKKLAGLLIENSIRNNEFNYSIVGIGINVNQETFSTDAPNPTSFRIELSKEQDLKHLFNLLCQCLEARYLQLKSGRGEVLKKEYLNMLYRYNTTASYSTNGKIFAGKIIDVQDDGKLVVENETGKTEAYRFKEIEFVV